MDPTEVTVIGKIETFIAQIYVALIIYKLLSVHYSTLSKIKPGHASDGTRISG